jgi:hypothetical protein
MVPTLRHGDVVLVVCGRRGNGSVRGGDVVLATFRSMPDRLVLKRADHPEDGGWWLRSENEFAGGDSGTHGVADVHGRVAMRLRGFRPKILRRGRPHGA